MQVTATEFALLAFAIIFVLFAELVNTAIEAVVDLITPNYHPLAKAAKDAAAGAVLVVAFGAAITGYMVLAKYVLPCYGKVLAMYGTSDDMGTLVSILVVTIAVVMGKGLKGREAAQHGNFPSGHAALAFSIATAISLSTCDPIISMLSIALAAMVSHSRLLMGIQTIRNVILGACIGSGITLIVLLLFKFLKS